MDGLQGSRTARIDSSGSRIAFISDHATSTFMPRQNDDRSLEVYFFDVQQRTIRQITCCRHRLALPSRRLTLI